MGHFDIHDDTLLGAEDVARFLGISLHGLYKLRQRGTLPPAIKWGNTLRWRSTDIEEWLEQQRERSAR